MEKQFLFNLKEPNYSYMFGFMQADGHLHSSTRGRGRMSIELCEKDLYILEKFKDLIKVSSTLSVRTRSTNFKKNYTSFCLNIYNKEFRETIISYGIPSGKKSNIIEPSSYEYSEFDYWRGIIDADGSIGITATGKPFLSLATASENLATGFSEFIYKYTGFKNNVIRNKRDNIYNMMISQEKCQKIIFLLYYKHCLSLPRKYELSKKILNWKRPKNIKIRNEERVKWSNEEKEILLKHSIEECYLLFNNRKKTSVRAMYDNVKKKIKNDINRNI